MVVLLPFVIRQPPDEKREPTAEFEPPPELPEPELPEPELLPEPEPPRLPESVIVAAVVAPPEPDPPVTMIVSPGRMACRDTDWFLVILVDGVTLTLTVLPEVSVTKMVLPLTLATVPNEAPAPPAPPPAKPPAKPPAAAPPAPA